MRKLVAFLALIAFMPSAYADGTEVTNSGMYRVRSSNISNVMGQDGPGSHDLSSTFKWGINFKANDKFSANLTLFHDAVWGEDAATDQHRDTVSTTAPDQEDSLRVSEAYGSWMASDELSFRFGRGSFTMADGRVIDSGETDNANSFEGVMGTYDAEVGRVSFFGVKGFDLTSAGGSKPLDPEVNFYGLAYDAKGLPDVVKTLHFHLLKISGQESATGNDNRNDMRYGLVVAGDTVGLDYRLTYEQQGGDKGNTTKIDQKGSMMDAEFGFSMPEMMNMRFFVLYHADSGDDGSSAKENGDYDSFYYNSYDNAGDMGLFEWGNLTYIQAGITMNVMDDVEMGLNYLTFSLTEAKGANTNGVSNIAASSSNTETALGSEIDLFAKKKYDEGFSILGRYSMFTPDEKLFPSNKETISEIFLEAQMNF